MKPTDARKLIDIDIYLASLVSDVRAIDSLLDPLRAVTAIMPETSELDEQKVKALQHVRTDLEAYLLTKERTRVFTPESLLAQVEYHFEGNNSRRAMLSLFGAVALAVVVTAGTSLLVPTGDSQQQALLTASVCFTMLHLSAALLFIETFKVFTSKLRSAFRWICASIVVLGLQFIQQPFWAIFGTYDDVTGALMELIPLVTASVMMYVGARRFASQFNPTLKWLGVARVGLFAILAAAAIALLPHASNGSSEPVFDAIASLHASIVVLCLSATIIFFHASHKMAELYQRLGRVVGLSLGVALVTTVATLTNRMTFGSPRSGPFVPIELLLFVLMGCTFLYAGYVVNKGARY